MALIASENKADSTEISDMKMEFLIFWAADDYQQGLKVDLQFLSYYKNYLYVLLNMTNYK